MTNSFSYKAFPQSVSGATPALAAILTLLFSLAPGLARAQAPDAPDFAPRVPYSTAPIPENLPDDLDLTSGDFDLDGSVDFASLNGNSVSVFLNQGDGTFAARVDYVVPVRFTITNGDFDDDGDLDLAAVNRGNALSVLLNNGDGTFAPPIADTAAAAFDLIGADFNGDGRVDLAIANFSADTMVVLLSNGDGTFAAPVGYSVDAGPLSMVSADFDGDGDPDVATANLDGENTSVLLNNGDGTFAARQDYAGGGLAVAVGDFDSDGSPDLAVANNGSTAGVFLNNGDGTFGAYSGDTATGNNPRFLTTGDYNGDGRADLATSNNGADTVSVLSGFGNGTFAAQVDFPAGDSVQTIVTADFDADGRPDLAVAEGGDETVSVLLHRKAPSMPPVSSDPPRLTLPSPVRFPSTVVGEISGVQVIRLSNTGGKPVTGIRSSVRGGGRRDFRVSQPAARTLNPSASTTLRATFRPKKAGTRRATLAVTSNAATVRSTLVGKGELPAPAPIPPRYSPRGGALFNRPGAQ